MKLLWTVLDIVPGTEIFSRSFSFHADADAVHFILFYFLFLIFSPSMMPSNVQRYSYSLFLMHLVPLQKSYLWVLQPFYLGI